MRLPLPVFAAAVALLCALGCTQQTVSTIVGLNGTRDLVLVDQFEGDLLAGKSNNPDGGSYLVAGMPGRYLFVTSTATNELRVLENVRTGLTGREFLRAPNPLEALSIPVLDRPSLLAVDEGKNADGSRVTGSYVYATRPGASEVSVVSVEGRRQLGGRPMSLPAPVTALNAFMEVDATVSPIATPRPATTQLFVATWDGEVASVYAARLPTNSPEIDQLAFERLLLLEQTPITALLVVPPLSTRTLDGAPFCAARACLALALRKSAGLAGETLFFEPQTGRSVRLSFSGPVRELVNSEALPRIYGVLDEQACGSPACGGVVAVDLVTGTSASGFPAALDALGLPMAPMRSDGLITGLTVAAGAPIRQTVETAGEDGGAIGGLSYLEQTYQELGAYSSTSGVITFFSGLGGSIIDFDGRRSVVSSAAVRLPGTLADGGLAFVGDDGGVIGSSTAATVDVSGDLSETWRTVKVTSAEGAEWTLDLSDGYLDTQSIVVVYQGQIPGLVSLPTSAAEGTRLATGGFEARAAVGDLVLFATGNDTDGYRDCGRTRIAALGANFLEVAEVPAGCANRVRFSVRADGLKPLVVAADLEGYMGRWAPGETLTYNRPYVLLPADVTAARTPLTITIPPNAPRLEGAFTSFQVSGRMAPFRVSFDAATVGCYSLLPGQVVFGSMALSLVPTTVTGSSDILFRSTLFVTVPSGNGVIELSPVLLQQVGLLGSTNARCWR